MKKLFIGGLMGLIIFPSLAVSVHAQTTQVELTQEAKTELISEIKLQIQALILELIQVLQQQLSDLIAAQSQQGEQLNQIQNAVGSIQSSPAPVLGGTSPSPASPAPTPAPEQISINFTVANQVFDSPFTTGWRFISFGFFAHNVDACPARVRIFTDNPDGFAALNDDHNTDATFPSGYLACGGDQDLLMNTPTPGTYHVTVVDLDTGVSGIGEFTILPR